MSLRINRNGMAESASLHLSKTNARLGSSISKLSSGLRILGAGDDPAGLALSETLRRQVLGLGRASLNAQDGISMAQTAEGALGETQSIIQRMRELALQSASDTLTGNDRMEIQNEVEELKGQIDSISASTEFNTKRLLNGNRAALTSSNSNAISAIARGAVSGSGGYTVSLSTVSGGVSQVQKSSIFSTKNGDAITGATKLQDIQAFYDKGEFVLDSSQPLYLSGNGKSSAINVDGGMTLNELASSLQSALVSVGLTGSSAKFAAESGVDGGSLNLTSGVRGKYGNFGFSGNQKLMDSLGFSVARESANSRISVTLKDTYGNLNSVVTSENLASGLLEGIDIKFSSQAAQISGMGGIVAGLKLDAKENFTIDLGEKETTITVSSGDWSLDGIVRSMNSQIEDDASDIKGAGASASLVNGEIRITYNPTAPLESGDLTIKGSTANKLGFVNNDYSGFVEGSIDAGSRISGVSKYNTASSTFAVKFSLDSTVITAYQTVTSTTVADMKELSTLVNEVDDKLGSVAKFEVIGNSMTFTDYFVGKDGSALNGLSFSISAGTTLEAELKDKFGLRAGSASGLGDSTAELKIADSASQFQVGSELGDTIRLAIGDMSVSGLGMEKLDLSTIESSEKALGTLDKAMARVSSERAKLGAYMNRLDHSINVSRNTALNVKGAESRIRDVDMASEIMNLAKFQLLNEAGTSILSQANLIPKSVMKLLDAEKLFGAE